MDKQTPTPLVAEVIFLLGSQHASNITPEGRTGPAVVMADFARTLERDLTAARQRIEGLEADAGNFHKVMAWLRDMELSHGKCIPRTDLACTACNALDNLTLLRAEYRGAPVHLQGVKNG